MNERINAAAKKIGPDEFAFLLLCKRCPALPKEMPRVLRYARFNQWLFPSTEEGARVSALAEDAEEEDEQVRELAAVFHRACEAVDQLGRSSSSSSSSSTSPLGQLLIPGSSEWMRAERHLDKLIEKYVGEVIAI